MTHQAENDKNGGRSSQKKVTKILLKHESNHGKFNAHVSNLSSLKKMERRDVSQAAKRCP